MPEYIITNSKGKEKRYSFPTADAAASYLDYARQNNLKVDQVYFDTDNSEQRFPVTKIELDDKGVVHTEVDGDIDRYLTDRNTFTDAGYGFGQKPMSEVYREAYSKGVEPTFEITEGNGARIIEEHDSTRVVPREEYDPARLQRTVQSVQGLGDRMGGVLSDRGISPIDATQPMSKIAGRTSSPIVDKATEYASSEIGGERLSAEDAARMEESPEYRDVYWNIRRKYGMTPEEYATLSVDNINERIEEALDIAEDLREEAIADQSNWYVDIHGNRLNAKDDQIKATIRAIKRAQRDLNDSRTKYGEKDGWHLGKRFWDGGELIAKLTPIYNMISSLESAGVTMGQAMAAGKMIEDPERMTPEQKLLLSLTSIQQSVAQYQQDMGGKHWASGAGEVLQEMPEFMMGMPLAKLTTKAVTKGATKGLAKLAGKAIAETAEEATETAAETIARRALDKATGWAKVKHVASDGIGAWGKSFGEAAIGAPTQTLFYRSLADEALGQYQVRPDGSTIQQVTPAWERVYRAWLGTALELHSEDMGMWIGKGLNALGRRMANVGFVRGLMRVPAARSPLMEVVRKELKVADPLSEALGEVYGDAIQPLFTGDLDWSQTLADPDYWLTTVVSSAGVSVAMELPSIMQFKRDADRVNKYGHLMDLSLAVMGEDLRGQLVAAVSHNSIADQTKALANIDWKNVSRQDMAAAMDYVNAYVGRELYYNSYREAERQKVLQEQMNDLLALSYRSESGYENTMSIIKATAKPSSNLPLGREYYIVGGDYTQYGNLIPVKFIKNGHQEINTVFADQLNIGEPIDIADQLAKQYNLMFGEELAREGVVSISERIAQMRAEGVNEETIREVVSEDSAYHEYKEGDVVTDNQTGEPVTINEQTSTGEYIATKSSGERIAISYDQIADSGAYAEQAIERERTSGGVKEGDVVSFLDRDGEMVEGAVQQILSDGRIYVSVQTGENNGVSTYATQEITPNQIIPAEAQPAQLTPTEQVAEEVAADAAAEVQATEQTAPAEAPIEPQPAEVASTADPRAIPTLEDGSIDYDAIEDPQQLLDLYSQDLTPEEIVEDITSMRDQSAANAERLSAEVATAQTLDEKKALRAQAKAEAAKVYKYQAILDLLTPATTIVEQAEAAPTAHEVAPVVEEVVEPTTEEQAVEQSEISNESTENNADRKEGKEVEQENLQEEQNDVEEVETTPVVGFKKAQGTITASNNNEYIIKGVTHKGTPFEGKYKITTDEDGFTKITHSGDSVSELFTTPSDLGVTSDFIVGGAESFQTEEGYNDAIEEVNSGVKIVQIIIRPDNSVAVIGRTIDGVIEITGEAANIILDAVLRTFEGAKEENNTIPQSVEPSVKNTTTESPVEEKTPAPLQLAMSNEEFDSLLASDNREQIEAYLKELDQMLVIDENSPFVGEKALREEFKQVVEQYGGKDKVPAEVMDSFNARYQPYADLQRAIYDRKYALGEKLAQLNEQQTTNDKQKESEAKTAHKQTAFNGFLANKTDLAAATAEKALQKKYKFEDKNYTVAEYVEQAVASGNVELKTKEVPKYAGASRRAWNKMDAREQAADAERVKNSGTKTEYYVNGYDLGKTGYDYAQYLQAKAAEQTLETASESQTQSAVEPEWLQKVPTDGRNFMVYTKVAGENNYSATDLKTGQAVGLVYASLVKRDRLQSLVEELPKVLLEGAHFQIRDTNGKIYYSSEPITPTKGKKKATTKLTTLKTVSGAEVKVPINLYKYVSTDKTRAYTGVYFDPAGFVVATDGHNMIAVKHDVAEADAEKFISKAGDVASTIFNWRIANPKPNTEKPMNVDFVDVEKRIGGKTGDKFVVFEIDGQEVGFPPKAIHVLADFQRAFGGQAFVGDMTAGKAIVIRSGDNYAIALQTTKYADLSQAIHIPSGIEQPTEQVEQPTAVSEQAQQPTEPTKQEPKPKRTADRKIEDYGEKIAGARKDILRNMSKNFDNATIESLVALPFAKAFVKPDLKKLVEAGVLRPDDAKYAEAIMWVYINKNKPKARKTDVWAAKRGRETRITAWAKKTFDGITRLRDFIEADEATRDELIAQYGQLGEQIKANEDIDRVRLNRLNGGALVFGDLYSPNPIEVVVAALDKLNYQAGDKITFDAPIVKAEYLGRYFNFENQDGEKVYAFSRANSIEEAIDTLVLQVKIRRGDTDIQYPTDMFSITREDPIREPSGMFTVFHINKRGTLIPETVVDREAAEKKVADYQSLGLSADLREEKKVVGYATHRIRFKNRLTDVETIFDEKFGSEGEARQALEERYDEFNDLANDYVASLSKQKREQPVPFEVTTSWNSETKAVKYIVKNTETGDMMSPQLDTRKEAEEYYKNHIEEWKAKWQEIKDARKKFVFFDDNVKPREGKDYRNGRDVTAEDLATTFGFRGIQFGNWTNDADRQAALNQAYDAFMDLADILGVSPKALSLAGELGIAFGARGGGSALAHYEPDEIVINLTKTKGAGSLAHEWWHALDNYFSRQGNIPMGFVTSNPTEAKMREEMRAAWQSVVKAVKGTEYAKRSMEQGNYWGNMLEMTARLFGEWTVYELAKTGRTNHFLSRGITPGRFDMWRRINYAAYKWSLPEDQTPMPFEEFALLPRSLKGMPFPTKEETEQMGEAVRNLFDVVQEKVDEQGNVVLFQRGDFPEMPNTEANRRAYNLVREKLQNAGIKVHEVSEEQARQMAEVVAGSEFQLVQRALSSLDKASKTIARWLKNNERGKSFEITLPEAAKRKVRKAMGRDFDSHNITADGIVHALKNHGEGGKKLNEKSIPIRKEDAELIPYIMVAPDFVKKGSTKNNRESVRYYKNLSNGYVVVIEKELDNSVDDLETINMWAELSDVSNAQRTLNRTSETPTIGRSDAAKIRKDAEIAIQNDAKLPEFQIVYHGSGAAFDRFDHSFMGTGEGAQAYGWGTYVTQIKGIGETYAEAMGGKPIKSKINSLALSISNKKDFIKARKSDIRKNENYDKYAKGIRKNQISLEKELKVARSEENEKDVRFYEGLLETTQWQLDPKNHKNLIDSFWEDINDAQAEVDDMQAQIKQLKKDLAAVPKFLYSVDIIDNLTPDTYISWEGVVDDEVIDRMQGKLTEEYGEDVALTANLKYGQSGQHFYQKLERALDSDRAASEFLHRNGFVGIEYPAQYQSGGRADNAKNYVIFNENDLKIVDRVELFQDAEGKIYGWAVGGEIYLTPDGLNANTAIHEYSHLWVEALRKKDSKKWAEIKSQLKATPFWQQVIDDPNYERIRENEDAVASEVLARLTGKNGAERLAAEAQRIIDAGNGSLSARIEATALVQRVKRLLRDLWAWVARNIFGITNEATISQLSDMVVDDLLDETPLTDAENSPFEAMFIGELGANVLDIEQKVSYRMANMDVAIQMEQAGKSPFDIKIATGWERGADGEWRYEISDAEAHLNIEAMAELNQRLDSGVRQRNADKLRQFEQNNPSLAKKRQEMIEKYSINSSAVEALDEVFELTPVVAEFKLRDLFDYDEAYEAYPQLMNTRVRVIDGMRSLGAHWGDNIDISLEVAQIPARMRATLLHEIQHSIQSIEGFAAGGNKEVAQELMREMEQEVLIFDFAGLVRGELKENPDLTDRQVTQKVISELKEHTGLTREELESAKRIPSSKQRVEALAAARNPELYEYYWGVFQIFNAALDDEGNIDSMKAYRNLMGEVEARNTTSRRNMTAEQRRSSLGSTTEDVNRGVQIYRSRQGDDSESLSEESQYSSRVEALSAVAHDVAAKLNAPIRVITDMNDVPQARQSWKGWWQRGESGEQIVVVVPNNIDAADIERTILHEAVAHYGLRKLLGESQFNLLLDTVLKSRSEDEVQQRMRKYGTNDPMVVADEYIAEVAEGNVTPSMFERVVSAVRAFLRDVLGLSVQMTDNDIRYLLWQSKNALEGKSAFGRAMVMAQGKPLADMVAEEYGYARAYTAEEQQIIAEAQRNGTYLKAPNGKPTNLTPKQWVQVRTKAFKRWFGDWESNPDNASKIVDANGEPMVVWHRTPNNFTSFDVEKIGSSTDWGAFGMGFYFSADPEQYRMYGQNKLAVFLNAKNPLRLTADNAYEIKAPFFGGDYSWSKESSEKFAEWVKSSGYDSVVYIDNGYGVDEYVVYSPTQIKSAEINSGEFDPTDPDIRARRKDFLDAEGNTTKATPMKQAKEVKPEREFRANNLFGRFFETFWRYTGASQVVAGKTIDGLVIKAGEKELARRIKKGEELLRKRETPFVSAFIKKKIGKGDAMGAFQKLSKADKLQLSKVITGFNPVVDYMSAENRSESQGEYALKKYFDGFIAPLNESRRRMREVMGVSDQELETYVSGESSLERHNSGTDALSTDETKAWSLKKVEGIVTRFRSRLRNNMELQLKQQGANALSEAEKELLGEDLIKKLTEEGYDSLSAGEQMAACEAPVEVLWECIRALNNEHLNILLRAGRYSHDDIERIKSHDWRYYVPMFKQDLNVEGLIDPAAVYDVDVFYGTPSAPSLKPALGRDTKSQDVFRSMYQLGQRCVVFEVRNRVARSLYDFTIWANDHLGLFETRKYWHEGITYQTKTASGKWVDEDTMPSREEREQMLATQREIATLNRERLDISRQIKRLSSQIEEVHSEQAADLIDDALRGLVNRKEEILDKIVKLEADRKWRAKKSNFDFEDPTSAQAIERERTVRVWIDGREHRMVFADPDIARAVNGNKNGIVKAIEALGRLVGPFTRFRAQMNTQYSPDFIVSNTLRDYQHALLAMALAEQGDITLSFAKNHLRHLGDVWRSRGINYNPISEAELEGRIPYYSYERMRSAYIAAKIAGEQITEEEFDRAYRDEVALNRIYLEEVYGKARVRDTFIDAFQRYGGATGFIHQLNSKQIEKQLREAMLLKEDVLARRYVDPTTPFRLIRDVISRVSESMEDITRFATFMAHLDHGASVERAAQEAKEVTTNFNRRGELATGLGSLYMFFNASVQGSAQVMRLIKQHPRRAAAVLPLYALLGFMQRITRGMLWKIGAATGIKAFFFDDDDEERPRTEEQLEKEKAIRDYMYSDNLIIVLDRTLDAADTALDGIYLRIPQPNGFRAAYKVGVELAEVAMGEQRWDELPESLISTLAGEFVYGFGDTGELTSDMWRMVIPSAVQPISDLLLNKDFVNRTIYNEREYNPIAPAYTVAKSNTPSLYIDASRILNSIGGTDTRSADYNERYEKRAIGLDVPPEAIKYLVGEVFGGVGTFANRMWTTVELMTDGEKGNLAKRDIPFVNRVVGEFEPENVWPKYKSLTDQIEAAWSESSGFRAEQGIDMRKSEWKNPDVTYPYLIEHYKDNPYAVEMLRKRWLLDPYFKEIEDYTKSLKRLGEGASSSDRTSESRDMSSEAEIQQASRTLTEKFILELSKHVDWRAATNEEVIEQVEQITGEIKGKNQ